MTTNESRKTFRAAILAVLTTDSDTWPRPVIYAEHIAGDKYRFNACNAPAMPAAAILWLCVEGDSFGELSGDNEADADGIENNMFEDAVNDVNEAHFFNR